MNIFEAASRKGLLFGSNQGQLDVSDLWLLPLKSVTGTSLDSVAKSVNKELKLSSEESFVDTKSPTNTELELKMEIVKHIITVKLDEKGAKEKAAATRSRNDQIRKLIADKKNDELGSLSITDLEAMLEGDKA